MSKLHTEAMKRLEKKKKSKKNEAVGVWSEVIYRLSRNRAAVFGFCVIVILAFFAIFPQTLTQPATMTRTTPRPSSPPARSIPWVRMISAATSSPA